MTYQDYVALAKKIEEYNQAYYVMDQPLISDAEWGCDDAGIDPNGRCTSRVET